MNGILFKSDVWKAKLEVLYKYGEAQTRRLSGLKEINKNPEIVKYLGTNSLGEYGFELFFPDGTSTIKTIKPRYHLNEIVFIREAIELRFTGTPIRYLSDGCPVMINGESPAPTYWKWKHNKLSPMFLPADAARYHIKITGINFQRLRNISLHDIEAEGFPDNRATYNAPIQVRKYKTLWDRINPEYPWEADPWVVVYEFQLVIKNSKSTEARTIY
jgi:hypothetical protein